MFLFQQQTRLKLKGQILNLDQPIFHAWSTQWNDRNATNLRLSGYVSQHRLLSRLNRIRSSCMRADVLYKWSLSPSTSTTLQQ